MSPSLSPRGAAVFSPCGVYRYRLERAIAPQLERVVAFVMLNPSTATEHVDDPTIRRCIGFARSWDAGRLVIGNLFALRATDPRVMKAHAEPVGPDNDQHLLAIAREAHLVVCAWGNHGAHRGRARGRRAPPRRRRRAPRAAALEGGTSGTPSVSRGGHAADEVVGVSDLVDFYSEAGVRVWLRLDDDCRGDLDIVRIRGPRVGTPPEWFTEECSNSGLDMVLRAQWRADTCDDRAVWAVEQGLCPGQPFLVAIDPPHWYRCSYEYEEYDVEWSWELLDRMPRTAERAARAWASFYVRRREICEAQRAEADARRLKSETDLSAMYISTDVYWHGYYDECAPPDGTIIRLRSQHGALYIDGRAHGTDRERRAWEDLVRSAVLRLPHLTPEIIRALPRRW